MSREIWRQKKDKLRNAWGGGMWGPLEINLIKSVGNGG